MVAVIAFMVFWGGISSVPNQLQPLLILESLGSTNFGVLNGISAFV